MDDAEQLMPAYLRFVRGVVDSSDLPLNVSREILQESRDVKAIREGCTQRVLAMLEDLAENQRGEVRELLEVDFGQVLKEGVGEDFGNRERMAKLLRFASTTGDSADQTVSLADYVARMKEGQEQHLLRDRRDTGRGAKQPAPGGVPQEGRRGAAADRSCRRVDALVPARTSTASRWSRWRAAAWTSDTLEDEEEKAQAQKVADEFKDTGRQHQDRARRAREGRAGHQPAHRFRRPAWSRTRARSAAISNDCSSQAGQKAPERRPILEMNPGHPLVSRMKAEDEKFADWSQLLFDQAVLAEGGQLEDPPGIRSTRQRDAARTRAGRVSARPG